MGKRALAITGLIGLSVLAVACGAAPAAGAHVAEARPELVVEEAAPAVGRGTTLATAISGGEEEKADEPAPLPTTCGSEATLKGASLCLPDRTFAQKLCSGSYPEVALGLF